MESYFERINRKNATKDGLNILYNQCTDLTQSPAQRQIVIRRAVAELMVERQCVELDAVKILLAELERKTKAQRHAELMGASIYGQLG